MNNQDTRVLLVDDTSLARQRLRAELLKLGFGADHLAEATNGREAFDALKAAAAAGAPFRLVLSDWNMPEVTGLELLRRCRADGDLRAVKFMIVSSEGETNSVVEAIEAGADDYGVKPVSSTELATKIQKMLS